MSDIDLWQLTRAGHTGMAYYRKLYKGSKRIVTDNIKPGEHIIVYCEQGLGDILQMLRYIPLLIQRCKVTLHCPAPLRRLIKNQWPNVNVIEKLENIDGNTTLPDHDANICSMDFLYIFPKISNKPYIKISETFADVKSYPDSVGIAFEGSPENPNNKIRCCPLKHFRCLEGTLFLLQHTMFLPELFEGTEDMNVLSVPITDLYDTAILINSVDTVVTIDTAILHLAGAMGKPTFALLPYKSKADPRWGEDGDSTMWYPSVRLIRQKEDGDWGSCFEQLHSHNSIS